MKIDDIINKYDVPNNMWYEGDMATSPIIILNKGDYLHFYKNKITHIHNEKYLNIKNEEQIIKLLNSSRHYIKHMRKKKLNKICQMMNSY